MGIQEGMGSETPVHKITNLPRLDLMIVDVGKSITRAIGRDGP